MNKSNTLDTNKISICIPTYWTPDEKFLPDSLFKIYDHPTPINKEGTLKRLLNSLQEIDDQGFNIIIIASATSIDIQHELNKKMKKLFSEYKDLNLYLFSIDELENFHKLLDKKKRPYQKKFINLDGYGNIRNLCVILSNLLDSETAILIDDDEVAADKNLIKKATDFIGTYVDEEKVLGKTGLYLHDKKEAKKKRVSPTRHLWPKEKTMNAIFKKLKEGERITTSPIALGGAMVLHKDLYKKISFDPWALRGEDIDYVINCKLHSIDFFADNEFTVLHLPPEKPSLALNMRQDIYRFIYEKEKIGYAFKNTNLNYFDVAELDPFPGYFLKKKISGRALIFSLLKGYEHLSQKDANNYLKLLQSSIFSGLRYAKRNRGRWFGFQKLWPTFMNELKDFDVSQILTSNKEG